MAYFVNLFSPDTYEGFCASDRSVSGFRIRQKGAASRIKPGDKFVCYMTKFSRWFGVLEVMSESYIDDSPLYYEADDPFIVRFRVKPLVLLPREKSVPIQDPTVWKNLSFTRLLPEGSATWTGKIRGSLNLLDSKDGRFLEDLLFEQAGNGRLFPIDPKEWEKARTHEVQGVTGRMVVTVPQSEAAEDTARPVEQSEVRESHSIQAIIARIGSEMGLKIWIPRNDRASVLSQAGAAGFSLIDTLPLNYDEATLRTIEQIDVLWLKGRSIVRAFEVEHTTSIYSGLLRMADLMALQPNMNIRLHIVAPVERRDKVFQEIRRPVFTYLEAGPLAGKCTYLSYDSVRQIAREKHLAYLSDDVLEAYAEEAE
jgi:hypothetical protein